MEKPVMIFGASGLGQAALEIFRSNNILIYGFLDDDKALHQKEIHDITVLGKTDDSQYLDLIGPDCEAFIAVDENSYRKSLIQIVLDQRKSMPVNAIHQSAMISSMATIGHGNFVGAGVFLGTGAQIGHHCILHPRSVVDYEAKIGDYVQVGAGSIINSSVEIGEETFIGSGVTVVAGVKIGKKARVGAGSVVISDVAKGQTVFGNPAQKVK